MKQSMSIHCSCNSLEEIKELLPDIATLLQKYDINLTISYSSGMGLSSLPLPKEDKHSSKQQLVH